MQTCGYMVEFASLDEPLCAVGCVPMTLPSRLNNLTTDELVTRFKAAIVQGQPPQELVHELASRPGIVFIQATDSTVITLEKAYAAIRQIEQGH